MSAQQIADNHPDLLGKQSSKADIWEGENIDWLVIQGWIYIAKINQVLLQFCGWDG